MLPLNNSPAGPTYIKGKTTATSGAADTAENTLYTAKIPPLRKNDRLRITSHVRHTNSANNKTVAVKLGGTTFHSVVTTTVAGHKMVTEIVNRGATNSQAGEAGAQGTVDTSVETTLTITGTKATGGETLTLEAVMVELIQPPTRGPDVA
jgi:hypothetical protein